MNEIEIRKIAPQDNAAIAHVIRSVLEEFGANKCGTAYYDKETDSMYEAFLKEGSVYYVAAIGGKVVGGGGIYPTPFLPAGCCELVKLYLLAEARGKGIGKQLMHQCEAFAAEAGYKQLYLESMNELHTAVSIYERDGYKHLAAPLGNTQHTGCHIWMLKDIA